MTPNLETRLGPRALRLVETIAREGSLLRAGQSVGLSQSAVTKALQDIEATCGLQLFERTNRGVRTTPYGEVLVAHARLILTQLRHAGQELADLQSGAGGRVAVGTLVSAAVALLPAAIAEVQATRPNLTVKIVEGTNDTLLPLLRSGELDLVVGRLPALSSGQGIAEEVLCDDYAQIVVRSGHPLLARPALALGDLLDWRWILPREETSLRRQIEEAFRLQGLPPPSYGVESVSVLANRALILRSDYLAVWPVQLARAEAERGLVEILPIALPTTARPIGISTRREGRLSPAAALLIAALRQEAG
ncbi:MAG: LysR substrate-binding domain-containing protein [Paracoccaceae bacterium]|jgi:DNA-binding transcriptional LysR family regulator|nr:LysR family transcriptional regulator [Rhodobacter sp.]